jgi:two-component system nitrate/nitrite response regulator NarL
MTESTPERVRLLLLADVRLYREGLAGILSADRRIELLATGSSTGSEVAGLLEAQPSVLLVDAAALCSSHSLRQEIVRHSNIKLVAFGIMDTLDQALTCTEAGAAALVMGNATSIELIDVILAVHRGAYWCSPTLLPALFKHIAARPRIARPSEASALTRRELDIMGLLDRGLSNKEIARKLLIEVSTVKSHVHHILNKLQAPRRGAAAGVYKQRTPSPPWGGDRV